MLISRRLFSSANRCQKCYRSCLFYLNRKIPTQETCILASQATQIWYAKDLAHKNQHVVMHGQRRILSVKNVFDEDQYHQFDELPTVGVNKQNQAADEI